MTSITHIKQERPRLPWLALLALSTAVFITSLTETLPAGLLPGMSETLGTSASMAGQAVTVYAAGTALTAIPLARATARINRKAVLLWAMGIFAIANTLTAVVPIYAVMLVGRIVAGVAAGLAWAVLAGYARRLAPAGLEGRAISIAMTGIPVALALGVPVGTFIGQHIDWRAAFIAVTVATIGVIVWITFGVPSVTDSSSEDAQEAATTRATLSIPGVLPIMIVVLLYVLGHTVIYSYIAPYLESAQLSGHIDIILLVFGGASLLSIWLTGRFIDIRLRALAIFTASLFIIATAVLAATPTPILVWIAVAVWGLGWGGTPSLLQTAAPRAASIHSLAAADTAQAILVTLWNAAMALGGLLGGAILAGLGTAAIPLTAAIFVVLSLAIIVGARQHAFPTSDRLAATAVPEAPDHTS
ncbi:MFS transporter [Corynebacterium glyciniphilum]|uniref:MFS transporter n=1 Tax=Corynebacterium glyciniphilum TaxID=1404244 RepID=UPI003DA07D5B